MNWTIYTGSNLVLGTRVTEAGERELWEEFFLLATNGKDTWTKPLKNKKDEVLANQLLEVFQEQVTAGTFDITDGWLPCTSPVGRIEELVFQAEDLPDWCA